MFTHLHVHTEYSLLDGLSRIDPLVRKASALGMHSLAITDHGGLYGAVDFYQTAKDAGIRPIIGCEMYVAPGSRQDRSQAEKTPYHMTVLSKDMTGYRNLVKLVTTAHLECFYYKPRIDRELLEKHHEGLIVLSGCPSGEVPSLLSQGRMEDAQTAASWYRELFGEDYYLELMQHDRVPELAAINRGLADLNRDLDIPLVATNDAHYVNQQEAPLQDILICIHTNTNINDERRMKMDDDSYYLKSPEEMAALFAEFPQAVAETEAVAQKCELEMDFSQLHMPEFDVPDGLTADQYLEKLSREGLRSRMERHGDAEEQRLSYELDVIGKTQFADYFLVASDIMRFARDEGIFLAVRGSAAGSFVLYCLGATDVNPVEYRIPFERLLNIERREMPDIDMDFQDDRREEVLNYVVSKYGTDHVAQIITFGTLKAKAAIRDVGRALAMPYPEVDRIARLVPPTLNITLESAIAENPELKEVYEADESVRKLVDTARSLEGITRHPSTHAAGVVISDAPLDTFVPLQRPIKGDENSISMTQYAMAPVEALGLQKMDFLGLVNLTILSKAIELVRRTRGFDMDLQRVPLDDEPTFDLLSRGDTVGVFQLEGSGMTRYVQELKPSSVLDVASMIALYRPGPMDHITSFIDSKHGRREPDYPHPALKEILEETYGIIVYQDQVLLIVQAFAGYSLGEADKVRKAMGKKIPEIMAEEKEKFIAGSLGQGHTRELAEQIFALIEPFAGYAFGKAHSVSYGLISYWTAYLKANFPTEYMVCLANAYSDNTEKLAGTIAECRRLKIQVHAPDVNHSDVEFAVEKQADGKPAIRFGLAEVKNVGAAAVKPIVEAREKDGPFESIEHMCRVADMGGVGRKALESLIQAGAFDSFGDRGAILESVGSIVSLAQSEARLRDSSQSSMFDLFGETVATPLTNIAIPDVKTSVRDRRDWEMQLLSVAFTGADALNNLAYDTGSDNIVFRSQIEPELNGKKIVLVGQVSGASDRFTRDQKPYAIATIALLDGEIDVFVWQEVLEKTRDLWQVGSMVTVGGTIRARDDRVSISCLSAELYKVPDGDERAAGDAEARPPNGERSAATADSPSASALSPTTPALQAPSPAPVATAATPATQEVQTPRQLTLRMQETDQPVDDKQLLEDVSKLLLEFPGDDEVSLEIKSNGSVVTLDWPLASVSICVELEQGLRQLLNGAGQVSIGG